ncbi:MAG: WD40 repeat domain-containing protein [Bryobacteraceae bacterium]
MRAVVLGLAVMAVALAAAPPPVAALRFDGARLLVAGGNTVGIAAAPKWTPEASITSRLAQVFDTAVSPDGTLLAVAGGTPAVTGAVEIYDAGTRALLRTTARAGDLIMAVVFSPDGKRLAAASADHNIYVVAASSGDRIERLTGHVGPVLSAAYSPDGTILATGSADRSLRLWDAQGKLLRSLQNHAGAVSGAVFSSDSQLLYSAAEDATVRVWVVSNGRMKHIVRGLEAPVHGLAVTPSRHRLVAACADGGLRIVNVETGAIVRTVRGGSGESPWAHAAAVSGDGRWIAWADAAGQLRVEAFPE